MSNQVNTQLYERASEMIDQWEGTPIARVIEADLDRQDLDSLYQHVCYAEGMASQEEFGNHDVY